MQPHQLWVPIALFVIAGAVATLALLLWFFDRRHDRAARLQLAEMDEAGAMPALLLRPQTPDTLRSEGIVLLGTALGFAGTYGAAAIAGLSGIVLALPLAVAAVLAGAGAGKVVAAMASSRSKTDAGAR
jgi:hypothetical protein